MYSSRRRGRWHIWVAVMLAAAAVFCLKVVPPGGGLDGDAAVAIKDAVEKSAMQCYVVEGFYPPGLYYLEENYGLRVNREDYYVLYEIFASNIPPEVQVLDRKQ